MKLILPFLAAGVALGARTTFMPTERPAVVPLTRDEKLVVAEYLVANPFAGLIMSPAESEAQRRRDAKTIAEGDREYARFALTLLEADIKIDEVYLSNLPYLLPRVSEEDARAVYFMFANAEARTMNAFRMATREWLEFVSPEVLDRRGIEDPPDHSVARVIDYIRRNPNDHPFLRNPINRQFVYFLVGPKEVDSLMRAPRVVTEAELRRRFHGAVTAAPPKHRRFWR